MIARLIARMIAQYLRRSLAGGSLWLPLVFFLMVIILYPFAVGSDAQLLARTGGGMIWVAALLAAILPVDRLIAPDVDDGQIDQLVLRGASEEMIIVAKFAAHVISFALPLLIMALPGAVLLGIAPALRGPLIYGLAIGTPALAALAIMVAALGAGSRASALVSSLALLPLAIPIVIFGAGTLNPAGRGAFEGLAATTLVLVAMMPFVGGAALRAARE